MTPSERDDAILEHLRRFHLTTAEILHRLFFPGVGLNALRKVTGRLTREKKIRPCRLFEQRKYFVLTPGQAARMGEDRSIGKPFEYQGLVNAYGVLLFCVENESQPFTKKEFEEQFPELVIRGVGARNYYLDRDQADTEETKPGQADSKPKVRLGFIIVDYGTSPLTIRKKVHKVTARAYTRPKFGRLIQSENFVLGIIAPSEAKAEDIKATLADEGPGFVRYRIVSSPELGELLMNRGRLKDGRKPRENSESESEPKSEAPSEEGAHP